MDRRQFLKLVPLLSLPVILERERSAAETSPAQSSSGQHNVIILLFDTLSGRHLSFHGYQRATTPNLARFAERATVFHRNYSAGNFTTPSTASLLTGTYPWTHRAFHHSGVVTKEYEDRNLLRLLADTYHTVLYPHNLWANLLLNQFRRQGDTYLAPAEFSLADLTFPDEMFANDPDIAFRSFDDLLFRQISFPGSLFSSTASELRTMAYKEVGLQDYAELYPRGIPTLGIYNVFFLLEHVIDGLIAALSNARQPFLAYFHLFPPHEPYRPRREFIGLMDDGWVPDSREPHPLSPGLSQAELNVLRLEYDEFVAYTDAEFGRLSSFLEETGLLDESYVVITSDHGQLFERGVHGHDTPLMYEPVIHVPLLITRPKQQQREDVFAPTSGVDLMPTLLQATGHPVPDWCEGQGLPLQGSPITDGRSIFSIEAKSNAAYLPLTQGTVTLIRGQYKLIHYFGYEGYGSEYELYNLANDPDELENLYSVESVVAKELQRELEAKLQEVNRPYLAS